MVIDDPRMKRVSSKFKDDAMIIGNRKVCFWSKQSTLELSWLTLWWQVIGHTFWNDLKQIMVVNVQGNRSRSRARALSLSISLSLTLHRPLPSGSSASCWCWRRAKDSLAVQRPSSVARRVISPSQTTGNIEISATIQGVEKASKQKGVRAKSSLSIDIPFSKLT
jgi:uncharacterized protein YfiM (DUF2279 family)